MIGVDLCDPKRIEKVYKRFGKKFLKRIFSDVEIKDLETSLNKRFGAFHRIAGRFAAKEAIAKALGTGIGKHISFIDLIVISNSEGAPVASFSPKGAKLLAEKKYKEVKVSISHEKNMVIAFATAS